VERRWSNTIQKEISAYRFTYNFDPDKGMRDLVYTAEKGSSLAFQRFLAGHSLVDTKTGYIKELSIIIYCLWLHDTQVCFRVPLVCAPCTALEWLANNAEITSQH
jgi:hypothetical protein